MKKFFHCDKCGACCRNINLFGKPYEWLIDDVTGGCRYFNSTTNLCDIYAIRPLICNLEIGYHLFFPDMPWEDFVKQNQKACERLKTLKNGAS